MKFAVAAAVSLLAQGAGAQPATPPVTVGAASIGAVNVERTANFYETVFGFAEIRRIDARPQFLEVVLKPGTDATAARAAPGAALIIISHPVSAQTDLPALRGWARAHLLLVVPEMATVLDRTIANGGSVAIAPSVAQGSLESEVCRPAPAASART